MFKTIIWYAYFFLSIPLTIPALIKVKKLEKQGRTDEKVAFVHKFTSNWTRKLLKILNVKVNVHGKENLPKDKNVLFIGNHQGNFDIPIYISCIDIPKGFVAKIELTKMAGVKNWMEYMNCIFMDRSSIRKAGEAIITGINSLKSGNSLVVFPEGTRSKGDKMGEFKAGSFKLATKSKVPIVPVTMNGSYKIMEGNSNKHLTSATVDIYIHPMIETANLSKEEQAELPEKVKSIIGSKLPPQ
ncbi:lysophospholipid acyltransferase family protein [Clostridium gasigenes]|uniref:lysophospholipid acyltransferase family protein n=1 Tax=Clostridium gasigenes TaxID=94869 RepID=UPI001C0AC0D4|nr:lysophospholipid acyltransferase family protein [Clostridium gasigenes]MBU3106002.1 1-acyl-sn-glycerol-3-phosphate acyltransferase [Clostridium gasigenes]MBU3134245.1 1-acyl-sn-glycerol-3-phosphate acyltransferase [Clostridium gasigenes]